VELDEPTALPDGTRVTVEVDAPDEVFEYPCPLAPYDREKEIALLRKRYAEVQAGARGCRWKRRGPASRASATCHI
jgi:hypothetical protein